MKAFSIPAGEAEAGQRSCRVPDDEVRPAEQPGSAPKSLRERLWPDLGSVRHYQSRFVLTGHEPLKGFGGHRVQKFRLVVA